MTKPKNKKLLIILDSNAIIHRSFHALPDLRTAKGELVNAVYGFTSVLMKVLKEFHPDYVAASFDVAGPTFRKEEFEGYKAKRQKAPDELYEQMPKTKEVLEALGIPVYEREGFEADDVIGTISKIIDDKEAYPDVETIIVSGDLDTLQLVDDNTKVYTMRKGLQDTVLYDKNAVMKRFEGLKPSQMIDYKGLRGDASDNIPGVPGVGEKTAIKLLSDFKSLDSLYKNIEKNSELSKKIAPKLREKLITHKDQAFFSRDLATIRLDVPLDLNLRELTFRDFEGQKIKDIFNKFDFRTLLRRLEELHQDYYGKSHSGDTNLFGEQADSPSQDAKTIAEDPGKEILRRIDEFYEEGIFSDSIRDLERDLLPVINLMQDLGIKINKERFAELGKEMDRDLEAASQKIYALSGKQFNINSPQQLSQILFDPAPEGLGISTKGLKKTPGGVVSTAAGELEKLQGSHPVIEYLLKQRELQKLSSTYIKPLPELSDSNGRIHTHFDQFGASTGRISSSSPNLQNIPVRGEWAKRIRQGFVVEKGFKFLAFDYSQIELRIAAHISNDAKMIEVFNSGGDIHRTTAAEVFGVAEADVTSEMRYRAKALNFGILYGMGATGFAKSAGIPREEAQAFIENYFIQFSSVRDYIENTKIFAVKNKYTETLMGRKRFVPEISSSHPGLRAQAERMAINHPIQGTGADIIKLSMTELYKAGFIDKEKCRILLQIHDELLFECKNDAVDEMVPKIKGIMEGAYKLRVPLTVELKSGDSWGDLFTESA